MHVHVLDNALFIDNKDSPLGTAIRAQNAKGLRHLSVGKEVAQKGIGDVSQTLGPGLKAGHTINAETQNLGLKPLEPVQGGLVRGNLTRSDRGPG